MTDCGVFDSAIACVFPTSSDSRWSGSASPLRELEILRSKLPETTSVLLMSNYNHDSLMRVVFSDGKRAGEMLEILAGAELSQVVDFKSLRHLPGRFADEELRQHETDLLFSSTKGTGEALVYVLLEHQSTPVETMALRLVRYVSRIHVSIGAENMKAGCVPPIFPVVLYQGRERWKHPLNVGEFYDKRGLPPGNALPLESRFTLINLQDVADDLLKVWASRGTPEISLALLSMKHAWDRDFLELLATWDDIVRAVYRARAGRILLTAFVNYFLAVADTHHGRLAKVLVPMTEPKVGKMIKTAAERLIEEGMEKGIKAGLKRGRREGHVEGHREGLREGQVEALVRLLEKRFGTLDESVQVRIAAADLDRITHFLDRVLEVDTPQQLFEES